MIIILIDTNVYISILRKNKYNLKEFLQNIVDYINNSKYRIKIAYSKNLIKELLNKSGSNRQYLEKIIYEFYRAYRDIFLVYKRNKLNKMYKKFDNISKKRGAGGLLRITENKLRRLDPVDRDIVKIAVVETYECKIVKVYTGDRGLVDTIRDYHGLLHIDEWKIKVIDLKEYLDKGLDVEEIVELVCGL